MDNLGNPVPGGGLPPGGPPSGMVRDTVNTPATALLVVGGLGLLYALFSLVSNLLGMGGITPEQLEQMPPEARGFVSSMVGAGPIMGIIGVIYQAVIVFGALKMRQLQNYTLAMAACIMALIPCCSPCVCLGIPFGVWGLVVLMKPEVKAAFRK